MNDLMIVIPTMGSIHVDLAHWVKEQPGKVVFSNQLTPHARARNLLIDTFLLARPQYQYVMFVDSDTVPPIGAATRLRIALDAGADLATGITPIQKGEDRSWNVYQKHEDVESVVKHIPNHTFNIVGCGMSCAMIKRSVFEKLEKPYFKSIEFDDGNRCSEDLYFCDQLFKQGLKMVCDPVVKCEHFKTIAL